LDDCDADLILKGAVVDTATWVLLIIGMIPGFYLGRWRAESRRAHFDQDRVWASKDLYRR